MIQENTKSLVQIHILPVFLNQKSWKYKKLLYHTKWLWNLARKFSKDRKDLLTFKFSSSKTVSQFTFHPALAEASKAIQQSTYKQLGLSAGCYQFVLPKFHYIGVCKIPPHSPHNLHFFPYFLSGVNCWRKMPPHFHIFTFSLFHAIDCWVVNIQVFRFNSQQMHAWALNRKDIWTAHK